MSSVKRTKHAVYDTKYHLVWIPKYRKRMLNREIAEYCKQMFQKKHKRMKDHVHLFLSGPQEVLSSPNCPDYEEYISQAGFLKGFPIS